MVEHNEPVLVRVRRLTLRNRQQLLLHVNDLCNTLCGSIRLGHHGNDSGQSHDAHHHHIKISQKRQDDARLRVALIHQISAQIHDRSQSDHI